MKRDTMKKLGAVAALASALLLCGACGSDTASDSDHYIDSTALVSAYNKNADDAAKLYSDGGNYVTKSGISVQFQQSDGKVMGILAIRNKDVESEAMKKQTAQILAMVQNKKALKDEDKVLSDLHLTETGDSEVYQATSDKLHIEKIAVNTIDIGGVEHLNAPLTLVHFYSEGANDKLQGASGNTVDFKTFAQDLLANGVVQLDQYEYFPKMEKAVAVSKGDVLIK